MSAPQPHWRRLVFDQVKREVCDHFLAEAQPYLGLWLGKDGEALPAIAMENVVALPSLGAMSIRLSAGGLRLLYPMMLMLGEIRLGLAAPREAVSGRPGLREALSACYGRPCSRVAAAAGGMVFFDWIFHDEWIARVDFMAQAIADPSRLALLADAAAKAMQHLIVASFAAVVLAAPEAVKAGKPAESAP